MNQPFPPLPWVRAFEASARHLSFTHAAVELGLTQAAISKQVRLLEHHLGEALFDRLPRSVALTKIGAAYLPKVQDAFQRLGAGTEEVFGARRGAALTLRVHASFAVNWLAPRLPRFFATHPDVPLRILSNVWTDEPVPERFDLDIRYGLGNWPGFQTDQLTWEVLQPLCLPDIAATLRHPDDLAGFRLLHVMGYQEGWATWLTAAGAKGVDTGKGMHVDTSLMAYEVAAQGGGVALGRRSLAMREIQTGRLVQPFDLAVPIREAFHLISPQGAGGHPHAGMFREWVLAEAVAERSG